MTDASRLRETTLQESRETTLHEMFRDRARRYGNRTALLAKRAGVYQGISFNEVARGVERIGNGLLQVGIVKGDRVALLAENMPQWAMCDFATLAAGAVNVPIYPTHSAKEVQHLLEDSGSVVAIVSTPDQLAKILAVRLALPGIRKIVVIQTEGWKPEPALISLEALMSAGDMYSQSHPGALARRGAEVTEDDLASIIYTSGTTGAPKGVMLTHKNFLANVRGALSLTPISDSDAALSLLPLCHAFERTAGHYLMLHQGATIAYAESLDKVPQNMEEVRPTVVVSVPRMYEKMHARVLEAVRGYTPLRRRIFWWGIGIGKRAMVYDIAGKPLPAWLALQRAIARKLVYEKLAARLGGRLRFFVSGGAPLAREIAEFFRAAGVIILEGYGLSETSPILTVNTLEKFRFGSVGTKIPGVELRIAPDGEILARGSSIMQGYYKNPVATAEALEDGWFHTGDIGEIDADGFLTITDRKKDIIVTSGGKKVAPQNVENLLKSDEFIAQVVIEGDRRKYLSALIVPNFEALERWAKSQGLGFSSRQDLIAIPEVVKLVEGRIAARSADLAPYETIRKFVLLPAELTQEAGELTPTLKVKRKIVAKKYRELLDGMYDPA